MFSCSIQLSCVLVCFFYAAILSSCFLLPYKSLVSLFASLIQLSFLLVFFFHTAVLSSCFLLQKTQFISYLLVLSCLLACFQLKLHHLNCFGNFLHKFFLIYPVYLVYLISSTSSSLPSPFFPIFLFSSFFMYFYIYCTPQIKSSVYKCRAYPCKPALFFLVQKVQIDIIIVQLSLNLKKLQLSYKKRWEIKNCIKTFWH